MNLAQHILHAYMDGGWPVAKRERRIIERLTTKQRHVSKLKEDKRHA